MTSRRPRRWPSRLDEGAPERFGRADQLVAIAGLHHRLLWVHPFADGNGRATRLLSHALLRRTGIGSALWSVSRGLARNVDSYKARLARGDDPPQGAVVRAQDPVHVHQGWRPRPGREAGGGLDELVGRGSGPALTTRPETALPVAEGAPTAALVARRRSAMPRT
ncbi:Fic family protein [Roseomonas populi]|uniref:Fic family protein n=1 Tax=Roseomonas populi TaxID=3121582 RepID=UPI0038CDB438